MYERTEVVAEFTSEAEAQVALVRLRMDGIRCTVVGQVPSVASFTLLGRMPHSVIELVVAVSQADCARFILAAAGVEVLETDWESLAESAVDGWICTGCDTEVSWDRPGCPACGADRYGGP